MDQASDAPGAAEDKTSFAGPTFGFKAAPSTKDGGRVVFGGGFAGVADTAGKKVHTVDEYQPKWLDARATASE
jgi:hypothetical protein